MMRVSVISVGLAAGMAAVLSASCAVGDRAEAGALGAAPEARLLAPGTISTAAADEMHPVWTPDGGVLYFVRRAPEGRFTIYRARFAEGEWSTPEVASFSGRFDDQEPSVSSDGRRLYFTSDRPRTGDEPIRGRTAWVVEGADGGWGAPRRLEAPIRLEAPDTVESNFWGQARGPIEDPDGDLWFWAERPGGLGHTDLWTAAVRDGSTAAPTNPGAPLNSGDYETSLAFSPDGRFMIFGRDGGSDGYGRADLYISFRRDGGWTEPRNLGPRVNTAAFEFGPRISPDGRYLLFGSNRRAEEGGPAGHDIYFIEMAALEAAMEGATEPAREEGP